MRCMAPDACWTTPQTSPETAAPADSAGSPTSATAPTGDDQSAMTGEKLTKKDKKQKSNRGDAIPPSSDPSGTTTPQTTTPQ